MNSANSNPGKLFQMLRHFAEGKRLQRFQAEQFGDHCLHTTVSSLQMKYQIRFEREWVRVPNRFNGETRVKHYWLAGDDLQKARLAATVEVRK